MKDIRLWLIVGLAAVIILLLVFDKDPEHNQEREEAYRYEIAILKGSLDSTRKAGTTIVERFNTRAVKDSVSLKSKDREIRVLEVKLSKQRTPRVDTLILENPDLASYVETQSEIIGELKEQVDTLKASVKFHIQTNRDLIENHDAAARISARIDHEKDGRIERLEKQVKKKTRGNNLLKAGIVVIGVGAFILGSGL